VNLVDVIDGLSSGVCIIACLGFYFISGFIEEEIYVSYAVISLAAALLGFLPYNLSKKFKIFMGDTGALFTGFVLSTVALGGKYSSNNILGVLSPIVVLLIPIYETFFISILRINRGQSPFLGSKDHFALRLETIGIRRNKILLITYLVGILFSISSILIVASQNIFIPVVILLIISIFIISITKFLTKINI
jgi:UDP-GlcNAc:undecaprenyl-phosphate GlcNAc-1-phosphate transferase